MAIGCRCLEVADATSSKDPATLGPFVVARLARPHWDPSWLRTASLTLGLLAPNTHISNESTAGQHTQRQRTGARRHLYTSGVRPRGTCTQQPSNPPFGDRVQVPWKSPRRLPARALVPRPRPAPATVPSSLRHTYFPGKHGRGPHGTPENRSATAPIHEWGSAQGASRQFASASS